MAMSRADPSESPTSWADDSPTSWADMKSSVDGESGTEAESGAEGESEANGVWDWREEVIEIQRGIQREWKLPAHHLQDELPGTAIRYNVQGGLLASIFVALADFRADP